MQFTPAHQQTFNDWCPMKRMHSEKFWIHISRKPIFNIEEHRHESRIAAIQYRLFTDTISRGPANQAFPECIRSSGHQFIKRCWMSRGTAFEFKHISLRDQPIAKICAWLKNFSIGTNDFFPAYMNESVDCALVAIESITTGKWQILVHTIINGSKYLIFVYSFAITPLRKIF